jgi:hypothetical protein
MPTPNDSFAIISRTVRSDTELPPDVSEEALHLFEAQRELRAMRDRVRHLEQALRAAGRVLAPYAGGNGTGR